MSNHSSSSSARRHSQYYFADGNVILQVEDILFKIHSSRLMQESETFRDMFALPAAQDPPGQQLAEHERRATSQEGACDENPIVIPGITHQSFSNFLFVFYGRPSDSKYRTMMVDALLITSENPLPRVYQYLDIADLSHRFGAAELEAWAAGQLDKVSHSTNQLSRGKQNLKYQLRALSYARITQKKPLEHQIRTFVKLSYSYVLPGSSVPLQGPEVKSHQRNLLAAFKYPNLQKDHPSLFGFLLSVILSLGYEFWLHHPSLAREDRIMLLSAQAHLTPLPFSALGLDWIEDTLTTANPRGSDPEIQTCVHCNYQPVWAQVFTVQYIDGIKKRDSLSGIRLLAHLVAKRMRLQEALPIISVNCRDFCTIHIVGFVDDKIEHVFTLLADFYKDLQ